MKLGVFATTLGGASVEFFETAAIADAIARSGDPREAIWGTFSGLIAVGSASAILAVGLQVIPLHTLQLFIAIVLLWFGWSCYKNSSRYLRSVRGSNTVEI